MNKSVNTSKNEIIVLRKFINDKGRDKMVSSFSSSRELRDACMNMIDDNSIEAMTKAEALHFMPDFNVATVSQIANFYETPKSTIYQIYTKHKDEIQKDGVFNINTKTLKNKHIDINCRRSDVMVFSKKAILRIAMFLTRNPVVISVRNSILNIVCEENTDNKLSNFLTDNDFNVVDNHVINIEDKVTSTLYEAINKAIKGCGIIDNDEFEKRVQSLKQNINTLEAQNSYLSEELNSYKKYKEKYETLNKEYENLYQSHKSLLNDFIVKENILNKIVDYAKGENIAG